MPLNRRQVLVSGTAIGFSAMAGCSTDCGLFGQGMPHDATIAVDRMESIPEDAIMVQFSQLPEPEQKLLRTAIEEDAVQVCMDDEGERTEAVYSFENRVAGNQSYLSYENEYYGLFVGITDESSVMTADEIDFPDGNPCC